jgi:hypothetical protein
MFIPMQKIACFVPGPPLFLLFPLPPPPPYQAGKCRVRVCSKFLQKNILFCTSTRSRAEISIKSQNFFNCRPVKNNESDRRTSVVGSQKDKTGGNNKAQPAVVAASAPPVKHKSAHKATEAQQHNGQQRTGHQEEGAQRRDRKQSGQQRSSRGPVGKSAGGAKEAKKETNAAADGGKALSEAEVAFLQEAKEVRVKTFQADSVLLFLK